MTLRRTFIAVGAVAMGVLSVPGGAAQAKTIDLAKSPGALRSVPMQYRPLWRWWWPEAAVDPAELDAELTAMKAAGFGGVEQTLLRRPDDWWAPAFRANVKHAVEKATSLGMRFDTTLGPEWPISSKAVDDISKGLSMQEAIFSAVDVVGPSTYSGPIPQIDDTLTRGRTLIAVTAARPLNQSVALPIKGIPPVVLDPKSAVNLTPEVKDGMLTWQVPAGRWELVGTWMRATGQRVHGDAVTLVGALAQMNLPLSLPDLGDQLGPLVPDHFSSTAIDATLKDYDATLFGGDMAAVMRRNGGDVFEDSLELDHSALPGSPLTNFPDGCAVCTNKFWTPSFLQEFRKRRGYDLTPLLPVIFEAFDLPNGGGARVRADYYRTLSDLLVANHYDPIRRWANAHGLTSRAQGYNLVGTDKTHVSTQLQLPDAESLDFGDTGHAVVPGTAAADAVIDDYRQIVSGAHLSGARQITLEAGADLLGEYNMGVDDYKVIADRALAAGVTTMALHGFAYRTYRDIYQPWSWPGWSAFNILFAESWNQSHPALAQWGGLAGYYGRVSAALQNGSPRVDLTVLSSQGTPHVYGSVDLANALRSSDYTWDRMDDASLGDLPTPKGRRILPAGPAYRALVIDSISAISEAAAKKALAIARRGIPVVIKGSVPSHGTSYRDAGAEDTAVKAAFDAMGTLHNVRHVNSGHDVIAALADLRVGADLRHGDLPIVAQHRRTTTGDVWFLYNNSTRPASGTVTFASAGRPALIDPWTGITTREGAYRATKDSTSVPISLAPGETTLVSIDRKAKRVIHAEPGAGNVVWAGRSLVLRDTQGGAHEVRLSGRRSRNVTLAELPAPMTVGGPWDLKVATVGPSGSGNVDLTLDGLRDWRNISQLANASGTGTYTTNVTIPAGWLTRDRGVLLDLGQIGGMLELKINGRTAPVASLTDRPRDVSEFLKPGDNEIVAKVATTVTNVIVGSALSGDVRYAEFMKNSKQPYGLLGPVKLIPYAQRTLATRRWQAVRAVASAKTLTCPVKGLSPQPVKLQATGGVTCAAARKLTTAAVDAARAKGFTSKSVKVHGYTCHVTRANSHVSGGRCVKNANRRQVVDWRY